MTYSTTISVIPMQSNDANLPANLRELKTETLMGFGSGELTQASRTGMDCLYNEAGETGNNAKRSYPIRRLETEVKEQDEAPDAALSLQPHRRRAGACSRSCGWLDEAQRLGELAHGETSFLQETHKHTVAACGLVKRDYVRIACINTRTCKRYCK
ncbi:hypothetical protein RvY_08506-1 [Ramazzottius varieornatus]|uniref:Uncharacterized protein n=1 Tax=Ramazzottius varieornatus TaxID=947166 RepID=A0A1D1V652_RAMVA|nr:hypothetical protein RvY_08506-1 [Ramazzottius varieornatus]